GRIIGGTSAYPAQFPFAAAITVQTTNSKFFCGGALISTEWVLTAGHCVYGGILFTIQLGSNSLTEDDSNRLILATSNYMVHPNFNPDTTENDIGLIKFRMAIQYTDYIQPPNSLPTSPILDYQNVMAIGWGQVNDSSPELSDYLNWVLLSSISNEECKLTYGNQITNTMVCVSGNFNEGPCIGDSGAPLIQSLTDGRMVPVGISSFVSGNGCESVDPSGYTRIYPYLDWIRNVTNIFATRYTINLGSNNLEGTDPNRVVVATATSVIHPDYNPDTLENDVGLIRLRLPVDFNEYITAIALPQISLSVSATVTAIGKSRALEQSTFCAINYII
ncbi:brachyurin-like, partial [Asbolus verrucosus]